MFHILYFGADISPCRGSPPSVHSLSRDLFQVTPVNRFHVAGGIRDPPSTLSQGLHLSQIHGVDLLNEVLICALNCTYQEEYKKPLFISGDGGRGCHT